MRTTVVMLVVAESAARAQGETATLNGFADNGLRREMVAVERFELTRLRDQEHLRTFVRAGLLLRVPNLGPGFYLDPRIGGHADRNRHLYRYVRPWTLRFIRRLGEQYEAHFHRRFMVSSLVRTCAYQQRLARDNPNAARCDQSSHVTGATVDIHKHTMTPRGRAWVRRVLLELEHQGLIQATEERGQPVFHVMVLPPYANWPPR